MGVLTFYEVSSKSSKCPHFLSGVLKNEVSSKMKCPQK